MEELYPKLRTEVPYSNDTEAISDPRLGAVKAKLENLVSLRKENVHFNERLCSNKDFSNPSIYPKLIEYVQIPSKVSHFMDPREIFSNIGTISYEKFSTRHV
jgi:hypothetical protein